MDAKAKGILDLLIEGNSRGNVAELLAAQGEGDPEAAIRGAIEALEAMVTIPREARLAWCLEALREVYRRLLQTGDYAGAGKAIKDYAQLSGVGKTAQAEKAKSPPAEKAKPAPARKTKSLEPWRPELPYTEESLSYLLDVVSLPGTKRP